MRIMLSPPPPSTNFLAKKRGGGGGLERKQRYFTFFEPGLTVLFFSCRSGDVNFILCRRVWVRDACKIKIVHILSCRGNCELLPFSQLAWKRLWIAALLSTGLKTTKMIDFFSHSFLEIFKQIGLCSPPPPPYPVSWRKNISDYILQAPLSKKQFTSRCYFFSTVDYFCFLLPFRQSTFRFWSANRFFLGWGGDT